MLEFWLPVPSHKDFIVFAHSHNLSEIRTFLFFSMKTEQSLNSHAFSSLCKLKILFDYGL